MSLNIFVCKKKIKKKNKIVKKKMKKNAIYNLNALIQNLANKKRKVNCRHYINMDIVFTTYISILKQDFKPFPT